MKDVKGMGQITPMEFARFPVWEFLTDRENLSDLLVKPVCDLPVSTLTGRIAGTSVKLANGLEVYGMLGNVYLKNPLATRHLLSLAIWVRDHWFHLSRYHDVDWDQSGPEALADALELPVSDVFPIHYDLSRIADGAPESCTGTVDREPDEKLSLSQLATLTVRV